MTTTVGTEKAFTDLVGNLLYLEHDAIAAYGAAIERLEGANAKQHLNGFKADHLYHVATLTEVAREIGIAAPRDGDAKQILATGKVKMGSLFGDSAIVNAMRSNEDDTVTAYERASRHSDTQLRSQAFFGKALEDERRHQAWMGRLSLITLVFLLEMSSWDRNGLSEP